MFPIPIPYIILYQSPDPPQLMHMYYLSTVYSVLMGVGFAFTFKQFQNLIKELFKSDYTEVDFELIHKDNNLINGQMDIIKSSNGTKLRVSPIEKDIYNNLSSIKGLKGSIEEIDNPDQGMVERFKNIEERAINKFRGYCDLKVQKEFTYNFNSISFISGLCFLVCIITASILRSPRQINDGGLIYDGVVIMIIYYLGVFIFLFIRDLPKSKRYDPVSKQKLFYIFLGALAVGILHCFILKYRIFNIKSRPLIIWSTLIFSLHYIAYILRILFYIPKAEKRYSAVLENLVNDIEQLDWIKSKLGSPNNKPKEFAPKEIIPDKKEDRSVGK